MEGLRCPRRPAGRAVGFVLRTLADGLRQQGSAFGAVFFRGFAPARRRDGDSGACGSKVAHCARGSLSRASRLPRLRFAFWAVCGATQRRAPIAGVCLKQPVLNGFAYLPESCLYSLWRQTKHRKRHIDG